MVDRHLRTRETEEETAKETKEASKEEQINDLVKKMQETEREFGGFSNIPVNHEYWQMKNQLQALQDGTS